MTAKQLEALSKAANEVGLSMPGEPGWPIEQARKSNAAHSLRETLVNLYRTGQLVMVDDAAVERIVPKDYSSLKAQLGHIVPCYDATGGCILGDEENEKRCDGGCFILSVYRAGAIAAMRGK